MPCQPNSSLSKKSILLQKIHFVLFPGRHRKGHRNHKWKDPTSKTRWNYSSGKMKHTTSEDAIVLLNSDISEVDTLQINPEKESNVIKVQIHQEQTSDQKSQIHLEQTSDADTVIQEILNSDIGM